MLGSRAAGAGADLVASHDRLRDSVPLDHHGLFREADVGPRDQSPDYEQEQAEGDDDEDEYFNRHEAPESPRF